MNAEYMLITGEVLMLVAVFWAIIKPTLLGDYNFNVVPLAFAGTMLIFLSLASHTM